MRPMHTVPPHALRLFLLLLTLCLAACRPAPEWHGTDITGVMPDLAFALTGSDGQPLTETDFAGRPTVLFFGFTNCPGPCPSTLAQVGLALDALGEAAEPIQVLLVSVDPDRDTPEAMATFTGAFGPWLRGATGDPVELERLRQAYKIHAQRLLADDDGAYDVSHGTQLFGFDRQGRCRLLWSHAGDTAALAADLGRLSALD